MTKPLEYVVALASVASAVFVGYQALLFRWAVDDPYLTNLQIRQLDACEEFAIAHTAWVYPVGLPSIVARTTYEMGDPTMVTVFPRENFTRKEVEEEYTSALSSRADDVGAAIIRLRVFAGPGEMKLDAVSAALTYDYLTRLDKMNTWLDLAIREPMKEQDFQEQLSVSKLEENPTRNGQRVSSYEEEAEPIFERCRSLMKGELPGLF
ncbi:hypothetical protein [Albibacillus kandeliae]|uniref:hypothetical protein n=1 Tax=Albibacillus kandeliae TaxID=2174228 RepID=UPI001300B36E|nr:hypothetical protein [Albibacillus kandeliae]